MSSMDFDYVFMPSLILCVGILAIWYCLRRLITRSRKSTGKAQQSMERVVLSLVAIVAMVVTLSSTINAINVLLFRPHDRPPGSIYVVNGHKMHIDCTGSGSPTLVLEAGLGNDWFIWSKVQPELSRTTRVCSYDRAGYGYSDPQPGPRDADHIAEELHSLLFQAQVTGRIVLMAHSLGGLFIRDYASRYPDEIAGLIFVDAVTPSWEVRRAKVPLQPITRLATRLAFIVDPPRLVGACSFPRPGSNPPAWKLAVEALCHPQFYALEQESDSSRLSGEETSHTGPYGGLPILIFSHVSSSSNWFSGYVDGWNQMQEDQKKLSSRSRRIIAKGSGHMIQLDRSDLIYREVQLYLKQIRGTVPQPTNYDTTIEE